MMLFYQNMTTTKLQDMPQMPPISSKSHSDMLSETDNHALTLLGGNLSSVVRDGFSQSLRT